MVENNMVKVNKKQMLIILLIISLFVVLLVLVTLVNSANENTIKAKNIAKSKNKSEYYGKVVTGYDCPNNNAIDEWKIFYADRKNIYLIASNYISLEFYPTSKTQSISQNPIGEPSIENVVNDYNGASSVSDELRKLNSSYYNMNTYSDRYNIKAVAYMQDTSIWNIYAGEKAEYAIGSPSLEMLLVSYNQKYGTDYQAKSDEIGYRISKDGGENWDSYLSNVLNVKDSLYVLEKDILLSSPSCYSVNNLMVINKYGGIGGSSNAEFRPIVCLKSDVELEKQENNTYRIK